MRIRRKVNYVKVEIGLFIMGVIITTCLLFLSFNRIISPKLSYIANLEFTKVVNQVSSNYQNLPNFSLDDLLIVTLNDKNEILTVDYQMQKIYQISNEVTKEIMENINKSSSSPYLTDYHQDNTVLLMMPMGIVSDYVFLNNLGPRIPVVFHFVNSVFTNVKTKMTNYGINNALVEIYLEVSLKYDLITPVQMQSQSLDFNVLLGAKIINGTVPNWYGNELITQSSSIKNDFYMI